MIIFNKRKSIFILLSLLLWFVWHNIVLDIFDIVKLLKEKNKLESKAGLLRKVKEPQVHSPHSDLLSINQLMNFGSSFPHQIFFNHKKETIRIEMIGDFELFKKLLQNFYRNRRFILKNIDVSIQGQLLKIKIRLLHGKKINKDIFLNIKNPFCNQSKPFETNQFAFSNAQGELMAFIEDEKKQQLKLLRLPDNTFKLVSIKRNNNE